MLGLTNKRLFQIHGWLGLNLGLLLFVVCFSGTIATLSHEIDWMLNPAIRVEPQGEQVSWGTMLESVHATHPESDVRFMYAPRGPRFAQETVTETPDGQWRRVYTNPYTGQVQGDTSYFNIKRFFRSFHSELFIGGPWYLFNGTYVTGFFGFTLLFSAVTGLLFYKKWWRYLFRLRFGKSRRVLWSDLHRMIGVWTLLFAVLIAVTGAWYFVERGLSDADVEAGRNSPILRIMPPRVTPPSPDADRIPMDQLIATARRTYPSLTIKKIWWPDAPRKALVIEGQAEAWLVRDRVNAVALDPYNGEVLDVQRGEELAAMPRWVNTADPLHFGNFGGLITKAIWFVLGLALSLSILAGAYIWHLRVRAQARPHRLGVGGWSAMGATAYVLAVTTYHTYDGIIGYGPAGGSVPPNVSLPVTLFIGGYVVLTLALSIAWYWLIASKLPPIHRTEALASAGDRNAQPEPVNS